MPNKNFTYLFFLTIILFFLATLSFLIQPRYETSLKKGGLIFDNVENQLNEIKEINIDNSKKKISIIKDNDNWYMASKFNYKVKNEVVRRNLIQISELRFFEKKTKEDFLYSRLDLDYPNDEEGNSKLISIINTDDKAILQFILGKEKKNGVYIKKLKDKQTWLTSGILEMSSNDKDWLETKILDLNYEDIKNVSIDHVNKSDSFSLTKDDEKLNFLINNLTKDQIPKSDLIANFIGYFFTNLVFEDVINRNNPLDNNIVTKINFKLFDDINISGIIFRKDNDKWVNIDISDESISKLRENKKIFVPNIRDWSYKLNSTKYNVTDAKLDDLLVED